MRAAAMPQQAPPMRVPVGSAPNFTIGPPPNNAQSIYATFNPRRITPQQHPGIYGTVGGARHPLLTPQGGKINNVYYGLTEIILK